MIRRRSLATAMTLSLSVLATHALRADVRADEKTKVEFAGMLGKMFNFFGGKGAREGVASTIAVKGDRKAITNDMTGEIIDLAEEKVYSLDLKKKTYRVATFAEIRQRMEDARKKAQAQAEKEQAKADQGKPQEPQVDVDFNIKDTGEKRTINGYDTHEVVVTITVRQKGKTLEQAGGLVMTSDMWLAPVIKEMKESRDFDMRYAQKLYGPMVTGASADQMAAAMAMYPMMKDAMAKMNAESGKISGTSILTVVTMDGVKSEEQMAAEAKSSDDQKTQDRTSVSGMLGGLARRAAAKKMAGGDDAAKARATFMTSTNEILKVSTAVAAEDVAVPAGFKETK